MLPMHSRNCSQCRKKSSKHACRTAVAKQQPVSYRGQVLTVLTPTQVGRIGNCPPQAPAAHASSLSRPRAGHAKWGTWDSSSGPRSSVGCVLRPRRYVMSWFYPKRTGRKRQSLQLQAGTACRRPLQHLRPRNHREVAWPFANLTQQGLSPHRQDVSQMTRVPPRPVRMESWCCSPPPSCFKAYDGRSMQETGSWGCASTDTATTPRSLLSTRPIGRQCSDTCLDETSRFLLGTPS